jgi:asparagine synthase (glutamine-hydrolysing)
MCGFVVWLDLGAGPPKSSLVGSMTEALRHRGPDEGAVAELGPVAFGHRRLRVIDLGGGSQPMQSTDRSSCVVFNGEIYNYLELRAELMREGVAFRTESDTEVLLECYRRHGIGCLERLRGMFAFVIWDSGKRRLFAARDRLGKKPLYYRLVDGKKLVLASEAKAILADPECPRRVDAAALALYLRFLYVPEGFCAFRDIQRLPPASWLVVEDGNVQSGGYWALRQGGEGPGDWPTALDGVSRLIDESVRIRMRSDVPISVFLSGGLDSAAVCLSAARQGGARLRTVTAWFPGLIDEREFALQVARHCGSEHFEVPITAGRLDELLWTLGGVFDEPFADTSSIPTFLIARATRELATVVLTGDGGDEVFAGYPYYLEHRESMRAVAPFSASMQGVAHWIAPLLRIARDRLGGILPGWEVASRWVRSQYRLAEAVRQPSLVMAHLALTTPVAGLPALSEGAARVGAAAFAAFLARQREESSALATAFAFDLTQYLPGDILKKVDMCTMAHGLEARSPLLDSELVNYAMSVPAEWKLRGGVTKALLRELVARDMGPEFGRREKQGFGVPIHAWLRDTRLKATVEDLLTGSRGEALGLWSGKALKAIRLRYYRGERRLAYALWALVCGEVWLRTFRVGV